MFVCVLYRSSAQGGGYSDDAQKRFSNAKSISSDQYFGRSSEDGMVRPCHSTHRITAVFRGKGEGEGEGGRGKGEEDRGKEGQEEHSDLVEC